MLARIDKGVFYLTKNGSVAGVNNFGQFVFDLIEQTTGFLEVIQIDYSHRNDQDMVSLPASLLLDIVSMFA